MVSGDSSQLRPQPLNAFCVDLEEWFHICGVPTPYSDPSSWDAAPAHVVSDTELLMRLLDEVGAKGTFLTVGWVAEKYPDLIKRLADAGHEIGCHSRFHRLIYELTPEEFEEDIAYCLNVLREVSGQPVTAFRAPGFSITRECFWAYDILARHGITADVSIVPASRDHGGVEEFTRDPFLLHTDHGDMKMFPVSVMSIAGKIIPFSGGGYLRLFPRALIRYGYRQNHRAGRPGMSYIHPRETNSAQPRLKLPWKKYFKYYVGLDSCEDKLRHILNTFEFTTVANVVAQLGELPAYRLQGNEISRCESDAA